MKTSRLEKFLINRNLSEKFKINMKPYHKITYEEFLNEYSIRPNAIDRGFVWSTTPERYGFWELIDIEWQYSLKYNNL